MSSVMAIFKQYMYNNLRDKISLFWHLLFPLLLLLILILIFSGVDGGQVQFSVSLVNRDRSTSHDMGVNVVEIFTSLLQEEAKENTWLNLYLPLEGEDVDTFQGEQMKALIGGKRHVIIVIPEGFNQRIMEGIGQSIIGIPGPLRQAEIQIHQRAHHQPSEMVASIFEGIIGEMNKEINLEVGFIGVEELIQEKREILEVTTGWTFSYRDYIVPGVILMGYIMTGLFLCLGSLLSYRDQGILRRYLATPLSTIQYFSGLILWVFLLSLIQLFLVYGVGALLFQVNLKVLSFKALLYYMYSLLVIISFGLLIGSLAKDATSGDALASFILYPMMFLGGLFFPVNHVPAFMQLIIRINPATYLINGIRDVLGVYPSFTPNSLNLLVPALWFFFSILFSWKRFKWEVS